MGANPGGDRRTREVRPMNRAPEGTGLCVSFLAMIIAAVIGIGAYLLGLDALMVIVVIFISFYASLFAMIKMVMGRLH